MRMWVIVAIFLSMVLPTASTDAPIISTVAGRYALGKGSSGDAGPASSATFNNIQALGKDIDGNLLIVDSDNDAIRKVSASGIVTTICGILGHTGSSGDNGLASLAKLNNPRGLVLDSSGNLYISDSNNYAIRKITSWSSWITTVVGQLHQRWSSSDPSTGDGTSVLLDKPFGLCVGSDGTLYFADNYAGNTPLFCPRSLPFAPLLTLLLSR